MSLAEGDAAPDFQMPATGGRTVSLGGYKGKPFILYFYPKADTPGCTKEACAFQEADAASGDERTGRDRGLTGQDQADRAVCRQVWTDFSAGVG